MKLARKESKKNQYVDGLDLLDAKLNKVKLQNGVMYISFAAILLGVLDSFCDILMLESQKGNFNIVESLLDLVVVAFGSVALERIFVKVNSNQKKIDSMEKEYEKDFKLDIQYDELKEMLEKNPRLL